MSRSNVKGQSHQGQKRPIPALSAACVRFMFSASSSKENFRLQVGTRLYNFTDVASCAILGLQFLSLDCTDCITDCTKLIGLRAEDMAWCTEKTCCYRSLV